MSFREHEHAAAAPEREQRQTGSVEPTAALLRLSSAIGNRAFTDAVAAAASGRPPIPSRLARTAVIQRMPPQAGLLGALAQSQLDPRPPARGTIRDPQRLVGALASAIAAAWSTWQAAATLVGVTIQSVTAVGGQLVGPPLAPLVLAGAPADTPAERRLSSAVANAFGTAFLTWQATVKVPGLPWYPPFAAFPGPVAPPTPNVPTPLAALTSVAAPIQALPMTMSAQFGDPAEEAGNAVCRAIGSAIGAAFTTWLTSTIVTNVLGTGPVPTWAPPMVPVGPVVGGVGNMTPGGLT